MNDLSMKIYHRLPYTAQTTGINLFELKELKMRHSRQMKNYLEYLYRTEKWKHEDFIKYQDKMLRKIIQYAYHYVPYYHNLYKKENVDVESIKTRDNLEKLPIVTKRDIIKNTKDFFSTKKEPFIVAHTSGTTGTPLELRTSENLKILWKAIAYRRDLWAGYREGEWLARFVGDTPVRDCREKKTYRVSHVMKRIFFPSYCLSSEMFPVIFKTLKKMNVKFIHAYPSNAYLLAKYLQIKDDYFPLKAVLYSSEPMYHFQREIIEERFQTKVFGFYAQAERIISATECEQGNYHLTMIDGIMEIVKNGERVEDGEKGFMVSSSLHNFAMPLIRYALNDYTGYKSEECNCGRMLPSIYPVETKLEDFVIALDGRIISPSLLTFPLKHTRNIIESQIVQESLDKIIVNINKSGNYTEEDEVHLLNSLKKLLGENMEIRIKYVKEIPQTKAFKKRFVINKLKGDYIEEAFGKLK